jgi:prepilin-type N-terminal cleavage/methylation domain-containing protein
MTTAKLPETKKGFTLIELLVVIGIIIILMAVTIIAINPARQFSQARDAERSSEVNQILNAVSQWLTEQGNTLDGTTLCNGVDMVECADGYAAIITSGVPGATECELSTALTPVIIPVIPADPTTASGANTGYEICRTGTRVQVKGTSELAGDIVVTR